MKRIGWSKKIYTII